MARYTHNDVPSGYTATQVNDELEKIETAINDMLDRKGGSGNQMEADLDMNSSDILNAGRVETSYLVINGEVITLDNLATIDTGALVDLLEPLLLDIINKRLDEIFLVTEENGEKVLTIDTVNDGGAADGPTAEWLSVYT